MNTCNTCCNAVNAPFIRRNPKDQSIVHACIDASHTPHIQENGVSYVAWFNSPEAKKTRKNNKIRLAKLLK